MKKLDLPVQVAKAFAKDIRALQAEPEAMNPAEIAQRQLDVLQGFQGPSSGFVTSWHCSRRCGIKR